jgi:hypothetical protein
MLLRPKPILGESWPGYLLRLAQTNELKGISGLAKSIGTSQIDLMIASPVDVLAALKIQPPPDLEVQAFQRRGKLINLAMHGRTMRCRVCPLCIDANQHSYIPASWDRSFEHSCRVHRIALLDTCSECGAPLTYLRPRIGYCSCGHKLALSKHYQLNFDVGSFFEVLGLSEVYAAEALSFNRASIKEQDALVICRRLLWTMKRSAAATRSLGRRGDALFTTLEMETICELFKDWPKRFNDLVHAKVIMRGSNPKIVILGKPVSDGHSFPIVCDALTDLCRRRQTSPRPGKRTVRMLKSSDEQLVGIRYLIDATGCTYDIAQYWIERGWLGSISHSTRQNGQIAYGISKQAVQKAIQIVKSSSSINEASASVGLEPKALRYLASAGVIASIPYGRASWNVRLVTSAVFDLARQLLDVTIARRASVEDRLILGLALLRLGKRTPSLVRPFVEYIVSGAIPIGSSSRLPTALNEISLKRADFDAWRSRAQI